MYNDETQQRNIPRRLGVKKRSSESEDTEKESAGCIKEKEHKRHQLSDQNAILLLPVIALGDDKTEGDSQCSLGCQDREDEETSPQLESNLEVTEDS